MAAWIADFDERAGKDIAGLQKSLRVRVFDRIRWLVQNFDSVVPLPLHADLRGLYKLRTGDYRIVYRVDYEKRIIGIEYLDHRTRVYERKRK